MSYCNAKLRYFLLVNDETYRPYFNNDEEVLLLHVTYGFGDYKELYKFPKSLARFYDTFIDSDNNIEDHIRSIYPDANDMVKFLLNSNNYIEFNVEDLSKTTPKTIMKIPERSRPKYWEKYIINDAEAIFKAIIGQYSSGINRKYADMIPDDIWEILSTDIRFSWKPLKKGDDGIISLYAKELKMEDIDKLKAYPKYLAKYLVQASHNYNIAGHYIANVFDVLSDFPKYAMKYIIRMSQHISENSTWIDRKERNVLACIRHYYKKYEDNLDALIPLLQLSYKRSNHVVDGILCNVELIKREADIFDEGIDMSDTYIPTPYEYFMHALHSTENKSEELMDLTKELFKDNPEYMEIIMKAIYLHHIHHHEDNEIFQRYEHDYVAMIEKYKTHLKNIENEITTPEAKVENDML